VQEEAVAPRDNSSNKKLSRNSDPTTMSVSDQYVKALGGVLIVLLVLLGDPLLVAAKSSPTYSMEYKNWKNFAEEGLPIIVSIVSVISILLNSVKEEVKSRMDSVKTELKSEVAVLTANVKSATESTNARLDSTNARLDSTNARLDSIISLLDGRLENQDKKLENAFKELDLLIRENNLGK
jgi:hypothetical protein